MITRFNNVKMSTDSSDPNYYIVTEDSDSTPELLLVIKIMKLNNNKKYG